MDAISAVNEKECFIDFLLHVSRACERTWEKNSKKLFYMCLALAEVDERRLSKNSLYMCLPLALRT